MSVYFFKCTFSIKVQKIKTCICKVIFSWDTFNLKSFDERFSVGAKIAFYIFRIFSSYLQHIYLSCLFITVRGICMRWDFTAVFPFSLGQSCECGPKSQLQPAKKLWLWFFYTCNESSKSLAHLLFMFMAIMIFF